MTDGSRPPPGTPTGPVDREQRNRLVEEHLGLVDHHVRRYAQRRPELRDDLRQTAYLALVKSAGRFHEDGGASFATFANVSVDGELKRYFRDRTWAVRPPRAAQERYLRLRQAAEELTNRLGRAPTVSELGAEVGLCQDHVLEGLDHGLARQADQIDGSRADDEQRPAGEVRALCTTEHGYADTETRTVLRAALASMDPRSRRAVWMHFFEDRNQSEIAHEVGVSQSYVSRLLRDALSHLRATLDERAMSG